MFSPQVICVGGATLDRKYRGQSALRADTSNPVNGSVTYGGVARNVCEALARLGVSTGLATLVGSDTRGHSILASLAALGVATDLIVKRGDFQTAEYIAVLEPDGSLALGLADMAIFDAFSTKDLDRMWPTFEQAQWVFADCNLPATVLMELVARSGRSSFHLALDPVSVAKAAKLPSMLNGVDLLILNRDEASAILNEALEPETALAALAKTGVGRIILTDGANGLHALDQELPFHIPAKPTVIKDVTGAGDALIAGTMAGLVHGWSLEQAALFGNEIAALTAASTLTVHSGLSPAMVTSFERSTS